MSTSYYFIVADDDHAIADLLKQLIADAYPSATIVPFDNGRSALTAYMNAKADLLILDINMPWMTGIEVVQAIRARGDTTPIMLVSAALNQRYDVARDQATVFCPKPFDVDKLLDTIAAMLLPSLS